MKPKSKTDLTDDLRPEYDLRKLLKRGVRGKYYRRYRAANTQTTPRTDWSRLKKMRDRDTDHSDVPPLDASFFKNASLRLPERKRPVALRLDPDIVDWLERQGKGCRTRINAVLRLYMEAQTVEPK